MKTLCLAIVLFPLAGSLIAGLFGQYIGRRGAHWVTIVGVGLASLLSVIVYQRIVINGEPALNETVYTWLQSGGLRLEVGFLIDELSATMMLVVSFVSWLIHIYTIGYMHDDPGYQRFFSYISLFTFSMLMLVMSNNFLQLFFGWEAVGLVSYLLIGFWFKRESAVLANIKAFLVNRVGDFGFLLGIAAVLVYCGSLDYAQVFSSAPSLQHIRLEVPPYDWPVLTVICTLLFIGAMGKSAQVPLHVWLPDSMEGPTPISALIHAATMVTAGIFMVARMSPLYEFAEPVLNAILLIGAITALSMGILGLVQHDIKRVIAYSTLSQLGYMTVALGASAYAAAIFHLVTHAFFKALLFLGAGSIIVALHHEQDMRKMGGLYRYMPITWATMLAGSASLIGVPLTAGFYSKESIIEAVHYSTLPGAGFAHLAITVGVLITALYTFRMIFLTFHGIERMPEHVRRTLRESPRVITMPLLVLMIPSLVIGLPLIQPMLFGDYFGSAIQVAPAHDVLSRFGAEFHGVWNFILHSVKTPPFYLMLAGVFLAWYAYLFRPRVPAMIVARMLWLHRLLLNKYGFDQLYRVLFVDGVRALAVRLWKIGDVLLIDGYMVNGTAHGVRRLALIVRRIQSGYLYHYAFMMIIGLLLLGAIGLRWLPT